MKNEVDELKAALQPLVDASLKHPDLRGFLPRISAAVEALEARPAQSNRSGNGVESEATRRALAAIDGGMPAAQAAREQGLAASTVFRALKRRRAPTA